MSPLKFARLAVAFSTLLIPVVTSTQAAPLAISAAFSEDGTIRTTSVTSFVPNYFYLVAIGMQPVFAWEASVFDITSSGFVIFDVQLNPPTAFHVGGANNFIVVLGACPILSGSSYPLVRYEFGYMAGPTPPNDVTICVGPSAPSSFGGSPGYLDCAQRPDPFDLAIAENPAIGPGCAVINCTTCDFVATQSSSFGLVKSQF